MAFDTTSGPSSCSLSARRKSLPSPKAGSARPDIVSETPPPHEGRAVTIAFPGESTEYRAARDRLLEQEIELRRATEEVAVLRRALPPGGPVPEDYVFQSAGLGGASSSVRLSQLFEPGKNSLVIYNFMFPRDPGDTSAG